MACSVTGALWNASGKGKVVEKTGVWSAAAGRARSLASVLRCLLQIPFWAPWGGSDTHWHHRDSPAAVLFSSTDGIGVLKDSRWTHARHISCSSRVCSYSVSLFLKDAFHWCWDSWHHCQLANASLTSRLWISFSFLRILTLQQADYGWGG